jgi:hypothetical protein
MRTWPVRRRTRCWMQTSSDGSQKHQPTPTTTRRQLRLLSKSYKNNKAASSVSLPHTHLLPSPLPQYRPPSLLLRSHISTSTLPGFLGLLHGDASLRALKAHVADKAHDHSRTPSSLHPLLSLLREASTHIPPPILRSSRRLNPSMLRRGSNR